MARKFRSFTEGFGLGQRMATAWQDAQEREELERISKASPEDVTGFTDGDVADLTKAADSGQYEIGTKMNNDGSFAGYTVTPKAGGDTGQIAMKGVTKFMGRTSERMTPDQVSQARSMAMADVIAKRDPARAMQMRQSAKAEARADKADARADAQFEREEAYQRDLRNEFLNSNMGRAHNEYGKQMADYNKQIAERQAALQAGAKEADLGAAPEKPTMANYTLGQNLEDQGKLLMLQGQHGKLTPESFARYSDLMQKVKDSGYTKALRLAQGGASLEDVMGALSESGRQGLDIKNVVSDTMKAGPDGVPSRVITYKDAQGNTRSLNALAELDSLGKADGYFSRFYQAEGNRRADAQLDISRAHLGIARQARGEAGARRAEEKAESTSKADAAVALFKEENPDATPAQIEAVRRGVIPAVNKKEGDITTTFTTDQLMGDGSGTVMFKDKQGNVKVQKMNKDGVPVGRPTVLRAADIGKKQSDQPDSKHSSGGKVGQEPKRLQNVTDADIKATAQKYGISEAEVRRRLGM